MYRVIRSKIFLCLLNIGYLGFSIPAFAAEIPGLSVNYISSQGALNVKHCFENAPDYLESKDRKIMQSTLEMQWQNTAVKFKRGYAELPKGESGCVSYQINTKNITNPRRLKQQHEGSLLLKIDQLLWQASDYKSRKLPQITFNHSSEVQVSAPWKLLNRTTKQTKFQMQASPRYSSGYIALGPLEQQDVMIGDSKLRVSVMQGSQHNKTELVFRWIKTMAESVAKVADGFPLSEAQVLVSLVSGQRGAVPWGQVNRAGGSAVFFVVDANKSERQLFADWTAAHEFSHLLTPYTPNDRWLSEGFASYHQNISRLRSGLLDEQAAWTKMLAGFERGQSSASKYNAPILKDAGRKNNMQMYWGGAVIALKAEVALQQQSEGEMNLSKALAGMKDCCLDIGKAWIAKNVFNELDRITNTQVFSQLYEQDVKNKPFPAFKHLLRDLGIKPGRNGVLVFDDSAPLAHIRKSISQG